MDWSKIWTDTPILQRKPKWISLPQIMEKGIKDAVAPYPKPAGITYEYGTAGVSQKCY